MAVLGFSTPWHHTDPRLETLVCNGAFGAVWSSHWSQYLEVCRCSVWIFKIYTSINETEVHFNTLFLLFYVSIYTQIEVAKDEASLPQSARILHSIQRGIRRIKLPNILQLANVSRLTQTLKKPWPRFPNTPGSVFRLAQWWWQTLENEHGRSTADHIRQIHKMLFRYYFFFFFLNMWRVLCEQFKRFPSHPHLPTPSSPFEWTKS